MNRDEFIAKLKKWRCYSDWHHRYYTKRARKYKRLDYWFKGCLGLAAIVGAIMSGTDNFRVIGATIAGVCAFLMGTVLPHFGWDKIVSGLKDEQEEWTRIFHGYEDLLQMILILDRDEMVAQEFQKVEEMRKSAELNDRNLPEDQRLLDELEAEVREYYGLNCDNSPTEQPENHAKAD